MTGYGGTVTLIGVEVANLDATSFPLKAVGTADDDTLTYTPTLANAGTFQNADLNTVFNFTNVTGGVHGRWRWRHGKRVVVDGTNGRDLFSLRADLA